MRAAQQLHAVTFRHGFNSALFVRRSDAWSKLLFRPTPKKTMITKTTKTLFKSYWTATALAASMLLPLAAEARVIVDVDVAPPPPRVVEVPAPRPHKVWVQGYYVYDGPHHNHVWHDGYWVAERPGYHYRPDHWEQRGNQYHRVVGGWERG
jgi:hypothetical protein